MSSTDPPKKKPTPKDASPPGDGSTLAGYATWQKLLCVVSIGLMVVGIGVTAWATATAPEPTQGTGGAGSALVMGLTGETGGDATDPAEPRSVDDMGPMFFRLGFSFFVGFAIAYAVRTFLKISIVSAGFFLMVLFGLQYVGIVEVRWEAMSEWWENVMPWLKDQTSSFRTFILGYLPSSAAALSGMAIGIRRK